MNEIKAINKAIAAIEGGDEQARPMAEAILSQARAWLDETEADAAWGDQAFQAEWLAVEEAANRLEAALHPQVAAEKAARKAKAREQARAEAEDEARRRAEEERAKEQARLQRIWEAGEPLPARCPTTGRRIREVIIPAASGGDWGGIVPGAEGAMDPIPGPAGRVEYWVAPGEAAPEVVVRDNDAVAKLGGGHYSHPPVRVGGDGWLGYDVRFALAREYTATSEWLPVEPPQPLYTSEWDAADAWRVADEARKREAAERAKARAKARFEAELAAKSKENDPWAILRAVSESRQKKGSRK